MSDSTVDPMSRRFGPPPGEDDVSKATRLRAAGKKVADIAKDLNVQERSAYRLLAQGKERDENDLYTPYTLLDAVPDAEAGFAARPPGEKEYLLGTWDEVEWSRATARYAWYIHVANPSLAPRLVEAFAVIYHNVTRMEAEVRSRYAFIIDLALRLEPWLNEKRRRDFFALVPLEHDEDAVFAVDVVDYSKLYADWQDDPPDLRDRDPEQAEELERMLAKREQLRPGDTVRLVSVPGSGPRWRRKRR